jgi:hypothetical protein
MDRRRAPLLAGAFLAAMSAMSAAAADEPGDDTARLLSAINQRVRVVLHHARARHEDLVQRADVLGSLLDGVESVSVDRGTLQLGTARRKVAEARERAAAPPSAGTPVPAVLDAVEALTDRPPFGAGPERVRALAGEALEPLETNLVELAASLRRESGALASVREALVVMESGLRSTWFSAVNVSLESRRGALGLTPDFGPQQLPRPPFRTPRTGDELRDLLRAYQEDVQARQYDLARRVDLLSLLVLAGDLLPARGGGAPTAHIRQKLDEARSRAQRPPLLEAPVPAVLDRTGALLALLPNPAPPAARANHYASLGPLESNVLAVAEGLRAETGIVAGLAATLLEADDSLRSAVLEALRESTRAREVVLGGHPGRRGAESAPRP